ncbi:MAG: S1 RNA-binding domain-containing protein [Ruminococcus sp.]|nr:S1 RNA-binding domain-containing protein [Ruminococcus sp.]
MKKYRPEGCLFAAAENQRLIATTAGLAEAMEKGIILEARASVCDSTHNLIIDLPCGRAIIPREEGALGIAEGTTRDIALISRVNKIVSFKVTQLHDDQYGNFCAVLSRKAAQSECTENYIQRLSAGDVIDAKVTHLEQFGCFVDIGCGIPSLIPIDTISVSRISHPSDRFKVGEDIKAVVRSNENNRICLTHKELLGTWEENAAAFQAGETVSGIVRSVEDYGIFVELAPNLAGLAEPKEGIRIGQSVSVYIKAMIPEKMKIKLIIVDVCEDAPAPAKLPYFCMENHISEWQYAPECSNKSILTAFE